MNYVNSRDSIEAPSSSAYGVYGSKKPLSRQMIDHLKGKSREDIRKTNINARAARIAIAVASVGLAVGAGLAAERDVVDESTAIVGATATGLAALATSYAVGSMRTNRMDNIVAGYAKQLDLSSGDPNQRIRSISEDGITFGSTVDERVRDDPSEGEHLTVPFATYFATLGSNLATILMTGDHVETTTIVPVFGMTALMSGMQCLSAIQTMGSERNRHDAQLDILADAAWAEVIGATHQDTRE
jgi:hypothetical protein